jgi:hypothetical protein
MSAVATPLGVRLLKVGPLSGFFFVPPVWQPDGDGGGEFVTVRENVPVAVAPVASVTVTWNVDVPSVDGAPNARPDGRSVIPAGSVPDHLYGSVPPVARNVVVKKLFTNTLLPAPTSQTPFAQVKKRVSIASAGAVVPGAVVPVPVREARCGLFGALSVTTSEAVRVPTFWGLKAIDMVQLVPTASVIPEQPSPTTVKSSVFGTAALLMKSDAVPLFVTDTNWPALRVPMSWEPKSSEAGESETAGADGGGGGGDGCDDVHPESDAVAEETPSLTVTWQVEDE